MSPHDPGPRTGRSAGLAAGLALCALALGSHAPAQVGAPAPDAAPAPPRLEDLLWSEALHCIALHRLHPSASIPSWIRVDGTPAPPDGWRDDVARAVRKVLESTDDELTGPALHLLAAEMERERHARRDADPTIAETPSEVPADAADPSDDPTRATARLLRSQLGDDDPIVVTAALRGILAAGDERLVQLIRDLAASENPLAVASRGGAGPTDSKLQPDSGPGRDPDAPEPVALVDRLGRDLSTHPETLCSLARLALIRDDAAVADAPAYDRLAEGLHDLAPEADPLAMAAVTQWIGRLPLDPRTPDSGDARAPLIAALRDIAGIEARPNLRLFRPTDREGRGDREAVPDGLRVHAIAALAALLGPGGSAAHQGVKRDLEEALRSEALPAGLRAAAALTLGRIARPAEVFSADRTVSAALQRTLARDDDPRVRGCAALALGRIGGRRNRSRLLSRVSSDEDVRPFVLLALGVLAHGDRMVDARWDRRIHLLLASHVDSRDDRTRLAATLAAGLAGFEGRHEIELQDDPLGLLTGWLARPAGPGTASRDQLTPAQWQRVHAALGGSDAAQIHAAALLSWALEDPSLTERLVATAGGGHDAGHTERQATLWSLAHLADGARYELLLPLFAGTHHAPPARSVAADLLQRALAPAPFVTLTRASFEAWWKALPDLPRT